MSVTNGELAAVLQGMDKILQALTKTGDERHKENRDRLDELVKQATIANGRLRTAESAIAQHTWAFGAIGAGLLVWLGVWLTKVL